MDFLTLQFRNSDKSSITFCVRQQFWGALSSSAYVILSRFNCDCSSATTFYSSFHVWTRCTFEFYKQLLLHLSHFNNQNRIRNMLYSNQIRFLKIVTIFTLYASRTWALFELLRTNHRQPNIYIYIWKELEVSADGDSYWSYHAFW